jgi:hypothetical protein
MGPCTAPASPNRQQAIPGHPLSFVAAVPLHHTTGKQTDKMGLLSGWFSSSSSAGKIEQPSKQAASSGPAAAAGKPNVWRSVFDPGSNPNIDRVGSAYYDTVHKVGLGVQQQESMAQSGPRTHWAGRGGTASHLVKSQPPRLTVRQHPCNAAVARAPPHAPLLSSHLPHAPAAHGQGVVWQHLGADPPLAFLPLLPCPLSVPAHTHHNTATSPVYTPTQTQPTDKASSGSTWEQILKAEDFKRRSFSDIDRNQDGFVDAKVCACVCLCLWRRRACLYVCADAWCALVYIHARGFFVTQGEGKGHLEQLCTCGLRAFSHPTRQMQCMWSQ